MQTGSPAFALWMKAADPKERLQITEQESCHATTKQFASAIISNRSKLTDKRSSR